VSTRKLRSLVDDYLATPNPAFPGRGPTVPGISVSWSSDDCGSFTYAAGLRSIEDDKPMTPATLMGIASMTKPVIAAVALKLNEGGVFGADGLDTPVDRLLTPRQIRELTVGDDLDHPRCPGTALLRNRATGEFEETTFSCPDLSQVTLRHLMTGNHGMYDFFNEVLLPGGLHQYEEILFVDLLDVFDLDPEVPLVDSTNGFDHLKAYGLKSNDSALIGGNRFRRDFEISAGNTGYQLLGVILEHRTGRSLNELVDDLIVEPLGIDDVFIYVDPVKRRNLVADGYEIVTGIPVFTDTGVYPLAEFNGHAALNTLSLGLGQPANLTAAGGAAGLVANMKSYRAFLHAFTSGDLLGPSAQAELESSFVVTPDLGVPPGSFAFGLSLFRETVRGVPGFPDLEILHHGGSLEGVLCMNGSWDPEDPAVSTLTGALCINARRNAPNHIALFVEYARRILTARIGEQ
jgi:CubicO group peptidase (beta-lactamase class C family)